MKRPLLLQWRRLRRLSKLFQVCCSGKTSLQPTFFIIYFMYLLLFLNQPIINSNLFLLSLCQYDHKRITELSARLVNGISAGLTHVIRNGDPDRSYPGCVNLSFAFVEGESLLMALKDVALSSGRWDVHVKSFSVLLHFSGSKSKLQWVASRKNKSPYYKCICHCIQNWRPTAFSR